MTVTWSQTPEQMMAQTMKDAERRIHDAVQALFERYAVEIEAWLKLNAPWTDRTGNLRQSLHAWVEDMTTKLVLSWDYGLDYGRYLEFSNEGRFAVIAPALDVFWPLIVADLQKILT